ncbi:MAG: phosphoribosylaminoimidazolesuccinocarboxamide synthase [Janthinobacterium lividum]
MDEPGSASVPTLGGFAGVLDLPLVHVGKVRELYAYGLAEGQGDGLLMVATDRISAFDFVLDRLVPDKGPVLTQLSQWWFAQLDDIVDHHVLSTDVPDPVLGRAVVCERLDMVSIECVARGYLTGSGWLEYQQSRSVCGVPLPDGLVDGSRLPEPIFTPATKAAFGEHDENVDFATMVQTTGVDLGEQLRDLTLAVYARAEEVARGHGLILADTKLEFGRRPDGTLVLGDEVLTPDSSRYWDAATWEPGARLDAFDKQFVRDWLLRDSGWDRASGAAPPSIPAEVVAATRERYLQAYERLTGTAFEPA